MAFEQFRGRGGFQRMEGEVLLVRILGDRIPGQVEVKAGEDAPFVAVLLHEVVREVGAGDSLVGTQRVLHHHQVARDIFVVFFYILWRVFAGQGTRSVEDSGQLLFVRDCVFVRFAEEGSGIWDNSSLPSSRYSS